MHRLVKKKNHFLYQAGPSNVELRDFEYTKPHPFSEETLKEPWSVFCPLHFPKTIQDEFKEDVLAENPENVAIFDPGFLGIYLEIFSRLEKEKLKVNLVYSSFDDLEYLYESLNEPLVDIDLLSEGYEVHFLSNLFRYHVFIRYLEKFGIHTELRIFFDVQSYLKEPVSPLICSIDPPKPDPSTLIDSFLIFTCSYFKNPEVKMISTTGLDRVLQQVISFNPEFEKERGIFEILEEYLMSDMDKCHSLLKEGGYIEFTAEEIKGEKQKDLNEESGRHMEVMHFLFCTLDRILDMDVEDDGTYSKGFYVNPTKFKLTNLGIE